MRLMMWHCDEFVSEITEKGRSPLREEPNPPITQAIECLLVYVGCESKDEVDSEKVSTAGTDEIMKLIKQLGTNSVVLHPFAHMFGDLSSPQTALNIMSRMETILKEASVQVMRTPFGWFSKLTIRAKGHPLSRVARQI
jgi:threonyl-tRNA synthetase